MADTTNELSILSQPDADRQRLDVRSKYVDECVLREMNISPKATATEKLIAIDSTEGGKYRGSCESTYQWLRSIERKTETVLPKDVSARPGQDH